MTPTAEQALAWVNETYPAEAWSSYQRNHVTGAWIAGYEAALAASTAGAEAWQTMTYHQASEKFGGEGVRVTGAKFLMRDVAYGVVQAHPIPASPPASAEQGKG